MENMMNSYQSEDPTYCANGCGFFGSEATMNMCSKCYRDHHLKEEQSATVRAAMENSLSSKSLLYPLVEKVTESEKLKEKSVEALVVAVTAEEEVGSLTKAAKRCGSCKKKVGVVGFKCRCGTTFCGSHRYPEEHKCTYDYKVAGKEAIAKANPLVVADKLQRF